MVWEEGTKSCFPIKPNHNLLTINQAHPKELWYQKGGDKRERNSCN